MDFDGNITFQQEEIIGLILSGTNLNITDPILGFSGTSYPTGINPNFRGVNGLNEPNDIITLIDNHNLGIHVRTVGLDQMRIITTPTSAPIPEPTTIALLGIGLAGLAGAEVRRRRKKTKQ